MNDPLTRVITLTVSRNSDCENPLTSCHGMWTLYEGREVEQFFEERNGRYIPTSIANFFKIRAGLIWMLAGSKDNYGYIGYYVEDFDPNARRLNAVMVWENAASDIGATTREARKEDAASTLKLYEQWYSGENYGWIIDDRKRTEDSCWGFTGEEIVREAIVHDYLPPERPLNVILTDDQTESIIGAALDKIPGVETFTRRQWREADRAIGQAEANDLHDYDALEIA